MKAEATRFTLSFACAVKCILLATRSKTLPEQVLTRDEQGIVKDPFAEEMECEARVH